ncbi:MAG: ACT domain-containing protein, partial [Dongiaceae bacterium]
LLVEEDVLERAVHLMVEAQKIVAEGAGAAGLAALLAHPARFARKRVGLIVCGGNIDVRMLAQVLMRSLVQDGRVVTLRIEIIDQPGVLARLAGCIGEAGGNILEIHHQRMFTDLPVKRADIDAAVETRNADHVHEIVASLTRAGFPTRLLGSRST